MPEMTPENSDDAYQEATWLPLDPEHEGYRTLRDVLSEMFGEDVS